MTPHPRSPRWTADPRPDFAVHFVRGVSLFNDGKFWEAHEAWELLWLAAKSETREFLRGLIQLAAAFHHLQRGTPAGAPRLVDAALARLSRFPAGWCGVDRAAAEDVARRYRERASHDPGAALAEGESPVLVLGGDDVSPGTGRW